MTTCQSPRKVMRAAYHLARQRLPKYSCKFSRHTYTLLQLFACLVVKEQLKRSYRSAEALLRDCDSWRHDIGLRSTPDHNTLCRAAGLLLRTCQVDRLLGVMARWAATARILGLSDHPLAVDSTTFDSHHVSRHYERRCLETRKRMKKRDEQKGRKTSRSRTVRRLPKLAIAVSTHSHLVLSLWTGTGAGGDQPHYQPLVSKARARVPYRRFTVVGDAGYDSEALHHWTRRKMGLRSIIPPNSGRPRPAGVRPGGRWRGRMSKLLATQASRRRCGYTQRWQVETTISMKKRNLGSALAGKTAWSRRSDMMLKVLTHNLMIL